jgi:hypothetical protein
VTARALLNMVRAGYGAGLLLLPESVLARLARLPLDRLDVTVARVLGVRQLAQAAVLHRRPDLTVPGAVVDGLHAASMVAVSRLDGDADHRTLAARDARSAGLLTLLGLAVR